MRWALIVPWAASVVMTATIWRWMLDGFYGIVNRILFDLGLIASPVNDWLGTPSVAFVWLIAVAIFVSLPFTTYVILAGLQSIPGDIYEAARVDGATGCAGLPRHHPAAAPSGPPRRRDHQHDQRLQLVPDHLGDDRAAGRGSRRTRRPRSCTSSPSGSRTSASRQRMAVVNLVVILVFVLLYLRVVDWRRA